MGIGFGQLLVVFLLFLLFFGAKRLPELARAMGKAANEFQKAKNDVISSEEKTTEESKKTEKSDKA